MVQYKTMYGRDGELFVFRKSILLATAQTFVCPVSRDVQLIDSSGMSGDVVTGYTFQLIINDVTIEDEIGAKEIVRETQEGKHSEYSFQGIYDRYDGYKERIVIRQCTARSMDLYGLVNGFILSWTFNAILSEDQLKQIWEVSR